METGWGLGKDSVPSSLVVLDNLLNLSALQFLLYKFFNEHIDP